MAYDEGLADRIRGLVAARDDVSERKMFGGLAFMAGGHMFCGVVGDELMVRVGAENFEACLSKPGARPMDFTGRPMTGMLYVNQEALATALNEWVQLAVGFASALPPKSAKKKKGALRTRPM